MDNLAHATSSRNRRHFWLPRCLFMLASCRAFCLARLIHPRARLRRRRAFTAGCFAHIRRVKRKMGMARRAARARRVASANAHAAAACTPLARRRRAAHSRWARRQPHRVAKGTSTKRARTRRAGRHSAAGMRQHTRARTRACAAATFLLQSFAYLSISLLSIIAPLAIGHAL